MTTEKPTPPHQIGPYRVLDVLGEGGMGTVYLAEQREPVRRRVAVKVVKLGMDSKAVLTRFEAERKALAMMEHSCIAKVFDAGLTAAGQPFFAMEYVKGIPITQYCDENRLTLAERIRLFQQVCSGVQHAHTKGVMHRDLKPGNVLVAVQDGVPSPKIIDFGLAKATDHHLVEATLYTEQGVLIGTPEYMSPEQAGLGGLDIDTRTDVYSLGVLLHELLTGQLPFSREELRRAGYLELQRVIREQEPQRPSTKLTSIGEDADGLAAMRRVDARELRRAVRGDLDWIVLRAIEKDRTRRYETPQEFAADLERHLRVEPVLARPPSLGYRASKFMRRYRLQVVAAAVIALVLVGGAIGTFAGYREANSQAILAELNAQQARTAEALAVRRAQEADDARKRADREAATALQRAEQIERDAYVANVQIADTLLRLGQFAESKGRLDACPEALRGWEWHWLDAQDTSLLRIPAGQFELTADGTRLVLIDDAGHLAEWDLTTGRELAARPDEPPGIHWQWLGAGARLAVGRGPDDLLHAWNLERGTDVALGGKTGRFASVYVSPDGSRVVTSGRAPAWGEPTTVVWDAATGLATATLVGCDPTSVSFRNDGARIATVNTSWLVPVIDGVRHAASPEALLARVWDADSGRTVATLDGHTNVLQGVCFSPDGGRIATWSWDRTARIWDTETGICLATLQGHTDEVTGASFGAGGVWLATISKDGTVRVWRADGGECLTTLRGHEGPIHCLEVDAAGSRIATSGADATIRIWDPSRGDCTVLRHGAWRVKFAQGSDRIVTCGGDGVRVWDATPHSCATPIVGHRNWVESAVFSHDGRLVAATSGDRRVRVHDTCTGQCIWELGAPAVVAAAAFRGASRDVVTALADGSVLAWNIDTATCETVHGPSADKVKILGLSKDGGRLLTATAETAATLRHTRRGGNTVTFDLPEDMFEAEFSPDAERVVTVPWGVTPHLWDASTGAHVAALRGHTARVAGARFASDGTRMATASQDGTVRLWDPVTGNCLATLEANGEGLQFAEFSPDGLRIAACSWPKQTLRVWDVHSGALLARVDEAAPFLCFSRDGGRMVTGGWGVRVRDSATGTLLAKVADLHADEAIFGPDGTDLLSWTSVPSIRVDETIRIHHGKPYRARFPELQRAREALARVTPRIERLLGSGEDADVVRRTQLGDASLTRDERTATMIAVQTWLDRRASAGGTKPR